MIERTRLSSKTNLGTPGRDVLLYDIEPVGEMKPGEGLYPLCLLAAALLPDSLAPLRRFLLLPHEPLEGPLEARIALYWPDRCKNEVDNIKALLHALTGILWLDDGQIEDLRITKAYDPKNSRIEIEIRGAR